MERGGQPSESPDRPVFTLQGLEIILINLGTNPGRLNPDSLRHNQIVDGDWNIKYPVFIESGSSRIHYRNGLSIAASSDSITISQRDLEHEMDSELEPEAIVVPEVTGRYLQRMAATEFPFVAISIEPSGFIKTEFADSQSPLTNIALQIPFADTTPVVQARIQFRLDDRLLTIYVSESPPAEDGIPFLRFTGDIYRSVEGETLEEQSRFLGDVLENWQQDLNDFQAAAFRFHSLYS